MSKLLTYVAQYREWPMKYLHNCKFLLQCRYVFLDTLNSLPRTGVKALADLCLAMAAVVGLLEEFNVDPR